MNNPCIQYIGILTKKQLIEFIYQLIMVDENDPNIGCIVRYKIYNPNQPNDLANFKSESAIKGTIIKDIDNKIFNIKNDSQKISIEISCYVIDLTLDFHLFESYTELKKYKDLFKQKNINSS